MRRAGSLSLRSTAPPGRPEGPRTRVPAPAPAPRDQPGPPATPGSRRRSSKPSAVKRGPRSVGTRVTRNGKAASASPRNDRAPASVSSSLTARRTERERRSMATSRQRSRRSPSRRNLGRRLTSTCEEAEPVLLELAGGALGPGRGRSPAQALGLGDTVASSRPRCGRKWRPRRRGRRAGSRSRGAARTRRRAPPRSPSRAACAGGWSDPGAPPARACATRGRSRRRRRSARPARRRARPSGRSGAHRRGGAGVGTVRERQVAPPVRGVRSGP